MKYRCILKNNLTERTLNFTGVLMQAANPIYIHISFGIFFPKIYLFVCLHELNCLLHDISTFVI